VRRGKGGGAGKTTGAQTQVTDRPGLRLQTETRVRQIGRENGRQATQRGQYRDW
jgi:hypothetical protein